MSSIRNIVFGHDPRSGRVFVSDATLASKALERYTKDYYSADDAAREALIRSALAATGRVEIQAHPEEDGDTLHLFLERQGEAPEHLFLFAALNQVALARELGEHGFVLETFDTQVLDAGGDDLVILRAALEAWTRRNFPEITRLPEFSVVIYTDDRPVGEPEIKTDLKVAFGAPSGPLW